jgi:putative transposase
MARKSRTPPPDTIWEIPDCLWDCLQPILDEHYPQAETGRPRVDLRPVLNGIVFRMRTGCQWNQLPAQFGSDSTVHRWFQRFCEDGLFEAVWGHFVEACGELAGVHWDWQSADGRMGKARFGGEKGRQKPHRSRQTRHQNQLAGR